MTSRKDCFNPRAHVGRDVDISNLLRTGRCFNPRAHVGRDQSVLFLVGSGLVSIHAPTWDATRFEGEKVVCKKFQSTRPRGARRIPADSP